MSKNGFIGLLRFVICIAALGIFLLLATGCGGKATATPVNTGGNTTPNTPAATTWVRTVKGISVTWDEVWDSDHGKLYVSAATQDPTYPDMIVPIDPVTGTVGTAVAAGSDPKYLSLSSDSSYLWASLNGSSSVQRFLLPGLTKDIAFQVPLDLKGITQRAVCMQAAPVSPHALALVAGNANGAEGGNGVYVYDDATMRPVSEPGYEAGGPFFDWIQWGKDDSIIYATQLVTEGGSGIWPLQVNASGLSWNKTGGGLTAALIDYDSQNGLAYSRFAYAEGVYNPALDTQVGEFNLPGTNSTCTWDNALARYYCVTAYSDPIYEADVYYVELWVFDLNTYALLDRYYFGWLEGEGGATQPYSPITGAPRRLLRWGKAGLALITTSGAEYGLPVSQSPYGAGGVYLIDGAAVNPNITPDSTSGTSVTSEALQSSLSPRASIANSEKHR